jgi:two-component system sensor histidine kinase RegB
MSEAVPATPAPPGADPGRIKLDWLVRLHWVAILGETAAILGVHHAGMIELPLGQLLAIVALAALVNLGLLAWLRREARVTDAFLAGVMLFDTTVLTALLHLSGGHFNPFSTLYLVNVALAAILLPSRWSWTLLLYSVLAFSALFPLQHFAPLGVREHEAMMQIHLQGMLVAFAIAALLIVLIVHRVTRALAVREAELAGARSLAERRAKVASLATLAAGAAHELATPLSAIAVAARELERDLGSGEASPDVRSDLELIRGQVARCKEILTQMAAGAGENVAEPFVRLSVGEWARAALDGLPGGERVDAALDAAGRAEVRGPARALERALRVVLRNALQAGSDGRVALRARNGPGGVVLEVEDRGPGMPAEVLARAGEPFFTTKEPGHGTGLGLFLSRTLLEQLGGSLELESAPGRGTTARIVLPAGDAPAGAEGT